MNTNKWKLPCGWPAKEKSLSQSTIDTKLKQYCKNLPSSFLGFMFFVTYLKVTFSVCVCVSTDYMCVMMCLLQNKCVGQRRTCSVFFFLLFYHVGPRDRTHVIGFGSKYYDSLSHIIDSVTAAFREMLIGCLVIIPLSCS